MTAPAVEPQAAEVARLRAQLARAEAERDQARALLVSRPDPYSIAARRQVGEAAYQAGHADGFRDGYRQAEADQAAEWETTRRLLVAAVRPVLNPAGEAADAERRVKAAEAADRRDAADHERAFVARAYATPDRERTPVQHATVRAYPPPAARTLRRSA